MIRSAFIAALIGATALGAASADAGTVRYYARQKLLAIATAPTYTYTPSYGAYGTCTSGSQSASISSCTRSDGTVVANSFCSPPTVSKTCVAKTPVCPTLVAYQTSQGGVAKLLSTSSSVAAAPTLCNSYIANNNLTGPLVCYAYTTAVYVIVGATGTTSNSTQTYSSVCQ